VHDLLVRPFYWFKSPHQPAASPPPLPASAPASPAAVPVPGI